MENIEERTNLKCSFVYYGNEFQKLFIAIYIYIFIAIYSEIVAI